MCRTLPVGYMLKEYSILRSIGEGGFGLTYLAFDTNLEKPFAIKEYFPSDFAQRIDTDTVRPKNNSEAKANFNWGLERFRGEGRILAKLDKVSGVVQVIRYFEENDTAYIVMEFCEGESLHEKINVKDAYQVEGQTKILPEEKVKGIVHDLSQGLALVHVHKILHRDITPKNIMFDAEDRVTLIDFGSARYALEPNGKTITVLVTPGYAPIEQYSAAAKGSLGPFTDIYSIAAVAYTCLTGTVPPEAPKRMLSDDIESLGERDGASAFLKSIDWALSIKPEGRPQSIGAWLESWEDVVADGLQSDLGENKTQGGDKPLYDGKVEYVDEEGKRQAAGIDWLNELLKNPTLIGVATILSVALTIYYGEAPRTPPLNIPAPPEEGIGTKREYMKIKDDVGKRIQGALQEGKVREEHSESSDTTPPETDLGSEAALVECIPSTITRESKNNFKVAVENICLKLWRGENKTDDCYAQSNLRDIMISHMPQSQIMSSAQLSEMVSDVTQYYQDYEGYFVAEAFFPRQKVVNKTLKMVLVQGFLNHVSLENYSDKNAGPILLEWNKLSGKALTTQDVQMLNPSLSQKYGLNYSLAFTPSDKVGFSDLTVNIEDGVAGFSDVRINKNLPAINIFDASDALVSDVCRVN